jgi:hypothetical protein
VVEYSYRFVLRLRTYGIWLFFNASHGVDVLGLWIAMHEPASFCGHPSTDSFAQVAAQGVPPTRNTSKPVKDALIVDQNLADLVDQKRTRRSKPTMMQMRILSSRRKGSRTAGAGLLGWDAVGVSTYDCYMLDY